MDSDQFVDGSVEVVVELVVGDTVDLPIDSPRPAIAYFVLLRLLPAGMPTRMVDLERSLDRRIRTVRVNDLAAWKRQCVLANELDTPAFEGLGTRSSRPEPAGFCQSARRDITRLTLASPGRPLAWRRLVVCQRMVKSEWLSSTHSVNRSNRASSRSRAQSNHARGGLAITMPSMPSLRRTRSVGSISFDRRSSAPPEVIGVCP